MHVQDARDTSELAVKLLEDSKTAERFCWDGGKSLLESILKILNECYECLVHEGRYGDNDHYDNLDSTLRFNMVTLGEIFGLVGLDEYAWNLRFKDADARVEGVAEASIGYCYDALSDDYLKTQKKDGTVEYYDWTQHVPSEEKIQNIFYRKSIHGTFKPGGDDERHSLMGQSHI